ncbi:hypothetical protein ARMSODRAFT_1023793 [Armillaria solidipes]|uniref:Uncharacterized protein n=1 Tax=Armillaria solidipes TaxID=1076256 RepID=A0A2H3AY16_9AGAR|nr:hypothetical protein ARMSODRAFT_1023793 [Armillaria solidipes]
MPIVYAQYINKEVDTIDINDSDNDELLLPEDVPLYLPSAFTATEHEKLKVVSLGIQEGKLHKAGAYNAIISIRNAIKDVAVAKKNNRTHGHTQATHMRYCKIIHDAERKQNFATTTYHSHRDTMISLGVIREDDEVFQIITDKDVFHKDTLMKRNIGDTYCNDGHMLAMPIPEIAVEDNTGTQGSKRKCHTRLTLDDNESDSGERKPQTKKKSKATKRSTKTKAKRKQDTANQENDADALFAERPADDVPMVEWKTGWVWKFRGKNKWTDKEIHEWEEEGDHVQWFHAKANMQRWQEQWELRQAEFDHLLLALNYMKNVWSAIAINCSDKAGYAEAARQKQAMYMKMEAIAKVQLEDAGYKHLLDLPKDQPFWLHIATQHEDLEGAIARI